jgi:hypothetical protein
MKKATETASKTRLIMNCQSVGRIGKSTMHQGIIAWLHYAGIEFAAADCDAEHKTLSQWYGVPQMAFRQAEDILPVIASLGVAPVELIDFPAQATDEILDGFERFGVLKALEEKSIRATIVLFASEERPAMLSAAKILQTCGAAADYLVVKNPARFKSNNFESSKLGEALKDAPVIEIPVITDWTIKEVDRASKEQREPLTFGKAMQFVSGTTKFELEYWRNRMLVQCEDAAAVLVPDLALIKNKVNRVAVAPRSELNAFDL